MYSKRLTLLLAISLLSGCSTFATDAPSPIVQITNPGPPPVTLEPLNLKVITIDVVTPETIDTFTASVELNDLVFVAMTINDYEVLSLNIADMKTYIQKQKQIIEYYENITNPGK